MGKDNGSPDLPFFPFYPAEWLGSQQIAMMDIAAQGCYIRLLAYCWRDGFIPDDLAQLRLLCVTDAKRMRDAWQTLSRVFVVAADRPGFLVSPRLEEHRTAAIEMHAKRSAAATEAANARYAKDSGGSKRRMRRAGQSDAPRMPFAEQSHASNNHSSTTSTSLDKSNSVDAPLIPEDLVTEWPQDLNGLKRLANPFLMSFGNCKTAEAKKKHGPVYMDTLSAMRGRRGVTPQIAWQAFCDAFLARNGKPLFGASCKSALNYLPALEIAKNTKSANIGQDLSKSEVFGD
jgi:uncharacterized protein YdaU (DUF1376 family)